MARLIKPDGTVETVRPANQKEFTLEEMQAIVGGHIEHIRTISGRSMFINEDGKRLQLPPNQKATDIAAINPRDVIAGNALITENGEVS